MSNGTSGDTGSIERGGKGYPAFEWMEVSARILAKTSWAHFSRFSSGRRTAKVISDSSLASATSLRCSMFAGYCIMDSYDLKVIEGKM